MTCTWPISYAGCEEPSWSPEQQQFAESLASELLSAWTGYGECEVKIRPCRSDCSSYSTFWGRGPYSPGYAMDVSKGSVWGPALIGGKWYNLGCGVCSDGCSCDNPSTLKLPGHVSSVTEVLIDGVPLDSGAYRVDNYSLLVRMDGGSWPTCQALGSPVTEPGTWQVNYFQGVPVPMGGQVAAGVLAVELWKASCNDATCQLPKRVQSITRQGVTVALLDSFDDVTSGRTGIWLVDSWVASVTHAPQRARVFSVDVPRPRVQTWPATT